jgi:hypothetical protein
MRRRVFITLGTAAIWPFATRAQKSDGVRRVGVIMGFAENDEVWQAYLSTFRQALQNLGWTAAGGIEDAGRRRFRSRAMADAWRAGVETIGGRCAASRAPFRNCGTHSRRAGSNSLSIEGRNSTFLVACGGRSTRRSQDSAGSCERAPTGRMGRT